MLQQGADLLWLVYREHLTGVTCYWMSIVGHCCEISGLSVTVSLCQHPTPSATRPPPLDPLCSTLPPEMCELRVDTIPHQHEGLRCKSLDP